MVPAMKILFVAAAAVSLTAGCTIINLGPVKTRASIDLACPPEQIEAIALDRKTLCIGNDDVCATTAVARGCGQQTVYVRMVGDRESSPWIRNGEVRPYGAPPPAPVPAPVPVPVPAPAPPPAPAPAPAPAP